MSRYHRHSAVTLVELLVVISIIGLLAGVSAVAAAHAMESAKVARTHALIAKLDALVMQRWESYRSRRLPLEIPQFVKRPGDAQIVATPPEVAAQVRCDAIRELMRMEMPERWSDIYGGSNNIELWADPIKKQPYLSLTVPGEAATVPVPMTAASVCYQTFFQSAASTPAFTANGYNHQGAKCLYLLVTMGLEESDVLENFSADEIGDPDGSGCNCFLDAWGNPIEFLRWAPGFVSPMQPNPPTDADQTDPTGVYGSPNPTIAGMPQTFALYPLIYSAGPDGYYDIVNEADSPYRLSYGVVGVINNPFYTRGGANVNFSDGPVGTPAVLPASDRQTGRQLGSTDNITNHALGAH
jgi:prepilin-type N-terminal cleavage/methylation domain-containing protein